MKIKFKEYFSYNTEEFNNLWNDSIFIFDTNVLLNLYRYSEITMKEFINTISKIEKKLWLPHQIVKEFFDNRLEVIADQIKIHKDFKQKLINMNDELSNKNKNPFLSPNLLSKFIEILKEVEDELAFKENAFDVMFTNDRILEQISDLFSGKVGDNICKDRLDQIYSEGKERYSRKIPPGYKDQNKQEHKKYGDLVLWMQIMEKAKEANTSVIFITDDRKEDWWLEYSGKTISPHPELLREFKEETKNDCYFYKPFQFLTFSNEYLGSEIKVEIIKEVENSEKQIRSQIKELIEIVVHIISSKKNIINYLELLKTNGYQTSYSELNENEFQIIVTLPNIPDLERRFENRYLSLLQKFDLELLTYKKYKKSLDMYTYR